MGAEMNNDDLMFEYLIQMGAMRPEELEMKRKQAQVDALREAGSSAPEGQMVGKFFVPPSWTQYANQMTKAALAGGGQQELDKQTRGFNDRQRQMLEEMRMRRGSQGVNPNPLPMVYGTSEGE